MIRTLIVAEHLEVAESLCIALRLVKPITIVGVAMSLSSALCQARAMSPDVALVDMEMAGGSGYETVRQLKQAGFKSIALTAHDYPAAWEDALQAGAVRVIVKGTDLLEMVSAIQEVVGYFG